MKFKQETGIILGQQGQILHIIDGSMSRVEFPEEVIWSLHRQQPGIIKALVHTHPDNMPIPSQRDIQTLKTWAFALYPFPISMSVITNARYGFVENSYIGMLESKESWISKGKQNPRIFEDVLEFKNDFRNSNSYQAILIERSYDGIRLR